MNKGAEQAQHEANNAPWLTIAHVICTDAGIAHGPISGRLEALRDKLADKAQQTTEPELPEPFGYLSVHKVEGPFKYQFNKERAAVYPDNAISIDAVFTATQMHDHFAAGVRAGMARGQTLQALQRGFEKVLADPEKHGLDLGEKQ